MPMYDVLIRNGMVVNVKSGAKETMDIALREDRIAAMGHIEESAAQTIDAGGLLVLPGLIDAHTHLYPFSHIGAQPESACFPAGVTTAADAGGAGTATYEIARTAMPFLKLGVKSFLYVCATGVETCGEHIDAENFDAEGVKRLASRYPHDIVGLKIRMGRECVRSLGLRPLETAADIAHTLGLPLMVHSSDSSVPMEAMLACLDRNDVFSHAYHGRGRTILEDECRSALSAKARGVLFDVAEAGGNHCSYQVFREAYARGVTPDVISTDITAANVYKRGANAYTLLAVIGRMLDLGMPLEEVFRAVTITPAKLLKVDDSVGTLEVGKLADICLLQKFRMDRTDRDFTGNTLQSTHGFKAMLTIKKGDVVYRDAEL